MSTLSLSNYKPNFSDPRVQKRIKIVIDYCSPLVSMTNDENKSTSIHFKTKLRVFGKDTNPLTKYLTAKLLIEVDPSYTIGSKTKRYKINPDGYEYICSRLDENISYKNKRNNTHTFIIPLLMDTSTPFTIINNLRTYEQELLGNKPFIYKQTARGLYHPLVNQPREHKDNIYFPNWFDYDISVSMPTILTQLYNKLVEPRTFEFIERYIHNKEYERDRLSTLLFVDKKAIKGLINGLFQGMRLVPHFSCSSFHLLDNNPKKMNDFKNDELIIGIRREIKKLNRLASFYNSNKFFNNQPVINKKHIYFVEEQLIMNHVSTLLTTKNIHFFLEYDGFRSKSPINPSELSDYIYTKTGYLLSFSS